MLLAKGVRKAAMELTRKNPDMPPAYDFTLQVKGVEALSLS